MAITKVGTYRNPPEDITDYEAIVAHLNAYTRQIGNQGMILTEWENTSGTPAIAMGSYISHGGVLYVVSSEEAVSLPVADGTYYLKVAASGDTLALSWVSDISGYAWNAIANGLYHADESQVLPYMLIKTGTSIEKWKITNLMQGSGFSRVRYDGAVSMGSTLAVTGAISGASLNTGSGAMTFDQGVKTTDDVTFNQVTTLLGPNKPVDNTSVNMPQVGIGGFTYGTDSGANRLVGPILPPIGTYVVVCGNISSIGISGQFALVRASGGTRVGLDVGEFSFTIGAIAWRIA